ncbi:MAG: pyridoxal-phosphate dependent enzyme [Thermoanaerobaculales bacterium]
MPTINPNVARLRCSASGHEVDDQGFSRPIGLCSCCPKPGKPVVVEYDQGRVVAELRATPLQQRREAGIWAFAPLLPVLGVSPAYAADVGRTPTVRHDRLSAEFRVDLFIKNEAANPSGSFKDRGLAVGVALGVACGARRFCLPTQGNAGVAAALFSARLGLPGCLVYMPQGFEGCVYHRACEFFGAEVRFAGANIAAAGRKMRDDLAAALAAGELVDISTFFEPGRLEGKKTMGLEIELDFVGEALPEFVLYPTGGGTGLVGIWKAFGELAAFGLLDRAHASLPRMVAVQSEGCAPVVESFLANRSEVVPVTSRGTIADGLDVPAAIMGHGILRALRESGGTAVAVSEVEIASAFVHFGEVGINAGYESAACLAALGRLRQKGVVRDGAKVLLLATASHLIAMGGTPSVKGAS